ncbi:MAG: GNAT family N-acetyltransferase [Roseibium sp.]|nr:GNAT family N-acetyltransferase [Roseibium sp.]
MPGPPIIRRAHTPDDLDHVKALFRAYVDWLAIDLSYQGFEEELAGLPGKYAPPTGALFLAETQDRPGLGCVAVRPLDEPGICEMKRLYVRDDARGLGLGHRLVDVIVEEARELGYREMRLDTLPSMTGAISLYERHGFKRIPAYYDTPVSETVFFALDLLTSGQSGRKS